MIGPPVEHLGVQVRAGVMRKSGEKVFQQLDLQVADMHHAHLLVINKRAAPTDGQFLMTRAVLEKVGGFRPWWCHADSDFLWIGRLPIQSYRRFRILVYK